jgi:molecular chaperone HtpG
LDDEVREVRLSDRLRTSAACLVGGEHDISPQLEKIMAATGQGMPGQKRILEVNPSHPILEKLQARFDADPESEAIEPFARLLYGQAVLAEGGELKNPAAFARLVADLMVRAE